MAWSDIFIRDSNQTAAEQEENYRRQQEEYNRRLEERGLTTGAEAYYIPPPLEDQDAAAWEGAKEGAAEGFQNVINAPGKAVGAVGSTAGTLLGGILKNVPWWAYIGGAAVLFFWMGGAALLRGRLAKL